MLLYWLFIEMMFLRFELLLWILDWLFAWGGRADCGVGLFY